MPLGVVLVAGDPEAGACPGPTVRGATGTPRSTGPPGTAPPGAPSTAKAGPASALARFLATHTSDGERQPHDSPASKFDLARELAFDLFFAQSNVEGQLIEWLHQAYDEVAAVIINPAGLSSRSVAVLDALRMLQRPIVEVDAAARIGRPPERVLELWA